MRTSDAFPSKYLKAADLQGQQVTVKIDRVEFEMIGDDKKLIIYFQGKDRGVVLNRTNANNISAIYGDEMDEWRGMTVVLFEAMVDFQGKTVPAIRIKGPSKFKSGLPQEPRAAKPAVRSQDDPRSDDDMNDSIPF